MRVGKKTETSVVIRIAQHKYTIHTGTFEFTESRPDNGRPDTLPVPGRCNREWCQKRYVGAIPDDAASREDHVPDDPGVDGGDERHGYYRVPQQATHDRQEVLIRKGGRINRFYRGDIVFAALADTEFVRQQADSYRIVTSSSALVG